MIHAKQNVLNDHLRDHLAVSCRVCLEPVKQDAVLCSRCCTLSHSKCAARAPPGCDNQSKQHTKINQRPQYRSQMRQDPATNTTFLTSQGEGSQDSEGTVQGRGRGKGGQQDGGGPFKVAKARVNTLAKMLLTLRQ